MISVVDPAPVGEDDAHRYNDDLLVDPERRLYAQREFPTIFHVLDDEEVRLAFKPIDDDANVAKRRSQRAGILAVIGATLSLAGAAAEPIWHEWHPPWPAIVVGASALLGLLSTAVAVAGVLYGRRKEEWLLARFRAERLRQFHFQALIWTWPEIAESCGSAAAGRQYTALRKQAAAAFWSDLKGKGRAELETVLTADGAAELWLYDVDGAPLVPAGFDPGTLFKAYRKLRFKEQLGYADHKLTPECTTLRLAGAALRNQQQLLRLVWLLSFSMLVALHAALLIGAVVDPARLEQPVLHVVPVWLALVALAAKTLEESLGLSHEIERYEDYRTAIRDARHEFDRAAAPEARLRAMMEMERIAFDEMRSFLRTMNRSSFVL